MTGRARGAREGVPSAELFRRAAGEDFRGLSIEIKGGSESTLLDRYGLAQGGPGLGSVRCSPDKPMLLISSSHEKQTAIKPRASRDREFYVNESQ